MTRLPVIVGFGGFNAAGRSSFHQAYRRTVLNSLDQEKQNKTLLSLACMMKLVSYQNGQYIDHDGEVLTGEQVVQKYRTTIEENTLIRRIHEGMFDADTIPATRGLTLANNSDNSFIVKRQDLPEPLPVNWRVEIQDDKTVKVTIRGDISVKMTTVRPMEVQSAGILPSGFEPADQYNSRFHPRGLQMAILGASDALNSVGIDWQTVLDHIAPDEMGVYSASALGQTDEYGLGGYLQARLLGKRASSKQMPLSLNSMPADFINSYVCGSVGATGAMTGACATFLFNLRLAVDDIREGRHRLVICGSSEAPVTPEVMEGFAAMSALATDERLAKLDNAEQADYRRASRPFADNCGFTMGESSQYFVLMDDELAIQLGAQVYAAVPQVFVNADGFKKSISSPGAGNYLTLAKSVAATIAIVGEKAVKERSFVQAHGSSTPQNRVTESMVLDKVARSFKIENWPVTAVKTFVGHSLGPASGDQLANTLGVFADGILPGIKTADKVADDVLDEKLDILLKDKPAQMDVAFLNTKGFGGNNATTAILSPKIVEGMLLKRYGEKQFAEYQDKRKAVQEKAEQYDKQAGQGDLNVIYNFGQGIIEDDKIEVTTEKLSLPEFKNPVNLNFDNPYDDMS